MQITRRALLAIAFVLLILLLVLLRKDRDISVVGRPPLLDALVVAVYNPLQKGVNGVVDGIGHVVHHYFWLVGVEKENESLKRKLKVQSWYLVSLKEQLQASRLLDKLEDRAFIWNLKGAPAQVISHDPFASSQTIWIDAGSEKGVQVDLAVVADEGLVGRVIQVFKASSEVLLLVDSHFAVDVSNEETRERALVVGTDTRSALKRYPLLSHLEFLRLGTNFHAGDFLVTAGMGGPYPQGIPVGYVISKSDSAEGGDRQTVMPVVDFTKLEEVFVVTGKLSETGSPGEALFPR